MRLSVSIAAKSKAFAKAMRRIRPKFDSLLDAFEANGLGDPIHEAILIGVTDSMGINEIRIIPNRDGFFQAICGFGEQTSFLPENDCALELMLFERIQSVVAKCPFTSPDRATVLVLLRDWATKHLNGLNEA